MYKRQALMRRIISDIINSDEELHSERTATNGLEAINMLESGQRFDCIILDINMPKMNGIEFLKTMNRKGIKQNVIIVSTIAKEGAKETIEALELGAFDFVTKPDSLAEAKGSEFSNRLISMIYAACNVSITYVVQKAAEEVKNMVGGRKQTPVVKTGGTKNRKASASVPGVKYRKKLVALACSTGGPRALQYLSLIHIFTQGIALIGDIIIDIGMRVSMWFIVIGAADFAYQKWKFHDDMKMTKQEVKDEFKNSEGDPKVKSQQRARMQQASRRRMMQSVPQADVVITNPTHFAVAIKYDKNEHEAPIVLAKGADYLAHKIKDCLLYTSRCV